MRTALTSDEHLDYAILACISLKSFRLEKGPMRYFLNSYIYIKMYFVFTHHTHFTHSCMCMRFISEQHNRPNFQAPLD